MSKLNETELAVKIVHYLKERGSYTPTMQILNMTGVKLNARGQQILRGVLEQLARLDIVWKKGTGKFEWKFNHTAQFDPGNPLAGRMELHDSPLQPINPKPAEVTGDEDYDALMSVETRIGFLEANERDLVRKCGRLEERVSQLNTTLGEMSKQLNQTRTIEIKQYGGPTVRLDKELVPEVFDKVLSLAQCRRNILLVGPAGCGKTTVARLVAKALNLPFGALACTAGMSETKLLGKTQPNITEGTEHFQSTDFLAAYEGGGVFLLDELDAADANMLLSINSALANGYATVPNRADKTRADRHKDFVCIGTANTYGRGASRTYSGRNQLDEATVDRFRIGIVECDYDKRIEEALCPDSTLRTLLQSIRKRIEDSGLRRIMSTRFIEDAWVMKSQGGWKDGDILATFFSGWSRDELAKVGR